MKLTDGVYFYQKGDKVYLRDVGRRKDYLFSSTAWDILTYIQENPGCDPEDLTAWLARIYEVPDEAEFRRSIAEFLKELDRSGILISQAKPEPLPQPGIPDRVELLSLEAGQLCTATLELTYRCSERCIHCYVDDCPTAARQELTAAEYKAILEQLKELGCIRLLLTGGEVCLRKDLTEIAAMAVSMGFLVDIYTNGISMTDEQFDALCDMKVNSVSFSLYGGDAATHDAITRVPGSFEKTLKRMMMFKCAGVDTYIKTVVIRQNLEALEGLYRLGKRLGIDVKAATAIADTHNGCSAQPYRLDSQEQRLQAMGLISRYEQLPPPAPRNMDAHVCKAGLTTVSVDPYGGVHPCLAFTTAAGSLREASLAEIWKNAELMRRVRAFRFPELSEQCGSCKYSGHCSVCIGAAFEAAHGHFRPDADTCQWSQARYDVLVPAR